MTQKYARKPLIVDAECFDGTPEHAEELGLLSALMTTLGEEDPRCYFLEVTNPNLRERVTTGDYIVTFPDGTRRRARGALFEAEFTPIITRKPTG